MRGDLPYKNVIVAAIIVVIFAFIVKGKFANHEEQIKEVKKLGEELTEKEEYAIQWSQLRTQLRKLTDQFKLRDIKPFVEETAQKNKVGISYLRPSQEEEPFYRQVILKVRFTSQFRSFLDFISSLEKEGVIVEELTLRSDKEEMEGELLLKGIIPKGEL